MVAGTVRRLLFFCVIVQVPALAVETAGDRTYTFNAANAELFDRADVVNRPFGRSAIYVPVPQSPVANARILVRPAGDETLARSAMYDALARVDPTLAPEIARYAENSERITLIASTVTKLFLGCGLFAALLAISGIYGMSSNAVVLRSHEIGLRRALGASGNDIVATFVRQGVRQLARGLGVSAVLCALVLLAINQGFSVGAGTLALLAATVVAVVAACVLLSMYLAVRGVIRLEPSAALRSD